MGREKQKKATYLIFIQDPARKETCKSFEEKEKKDKEEEKREEEKVDRGSTLSSYCTSGCPTAYTCDLISTAMPVSQQKTESMEVKSFPESHKLGNNWTPKSPQFSV